MGLCFVFRFFLDFFLKYTWWLIFKPLIILDYFTADWILLWCMDTDHFARE